MLCHFYCNSQITLWDREERERKRKNLPFTTLGYMAYTRASILSATAEIQDHTKALKTGNTNDSISISFSRFSPIPSLLLCFPLPQISGLFFHLFSLLHFISFHSFSCVIIFLPIFWTFFFKMGCLEFLWRCDGVQWCVWPSSCHQCFFSFHCFMGCLFWKKFWSGVVFFWLLGIEDVWIWCFCSDLLC